MNKIMNISIENAKELLKSKINEVLETECVWLKEYDEIADWLSDNKGKGLLLIGGQGVGKTLICRDVMPAIFKSIGKNLVWSRPFDMAKMVDDMNCTCPWSIDDIGLEGTANNYGNRFEPFVEVIYNAENNGQLLILTTNMTSKQLVERYGERIIDRLKAIVRPIVISGSSMRK